MKFKSKKKIRQQKGFSLVEIIVSFALFTIIMTISLGALTIILDANAKAKSINLVINNLSLALENMSRELRVGSFYCADEDDYRNTTNRSCDTGVSGSPEIFFRSSEDEERAAYILTPDGKIQKRKSHSADPLNITGSDINITDLKFFIRGTKSGDLIQPSVLIRLRGETEVLGFDTAFDIQTLVSQRKLAP